MSQPTAPNSTIIGEALLDSGCRDLYRADFHQFFGLWAVEPERFGRMVDSFDRFDLTAHVADRSVQGDFTTIENGRIALIEIDGTMTKRGSSLTGGGTVELRQQIRAARRSEDIDAILIKIDSPGGTLAGTAELGDSIALAASEKPTEVFIEDLGASAAFWVASQAGRITVNRAGLVGSMGVLSVLVDASEQFENEGVRVIVVKAGEFKGTGVIGTKVTDAQIAEIQELVDSGNQLFRAAVGRGRGMSEKQLDKVNNGKLFTAADALKLGLVDRIGTIDDVIESLLSSIDGQEPEVKAMSESVAASLAELKAACPGAASDFLLSQIEANATVSDAQRAFIAHQQLQLEAVQSERTAAIEMARTAEQRAKDAESMPGNSPTATSQAKEEPDQSPRDQWLAAVKSVMARDKVTRPEACVRVDLENPGLRDAMNDSFVPQAKK